MPQVVDKTLGVLRWIEDAILALLLGSMISFAAAQVLLRNFFDTGIYWADSAVRVMVVWLAMVGAMVASRNDEHIRIDLLNHFLLSTAKRWSKRTVNAFTCVVLGIFTWASFGFVQLEYEYPMMAFASVPTWVCVAIMPFTAFIMTIRYAIQTLWPKM